jgi:hypothetical protein
MNPPEILHETHPEGENGHPSKHSRALGRVNIVMLKPPFKLFVTHLEGKPSLNQPGTRRGQRRSVEPPAIKTHLEKCKFICSSYLVRLRLSFKPARYWGITDAQVLF